MMHVNENRCDHHHFVLLLLHHLHHRLHHLYRRRLLLHLHHDPQRGMCVKHIVGESRSSCVSSVGGRESHNVLEHGYFLRCKTDAE